MQEEQWLAETIFTVDSFLTQDECTQFVKLSEDSGYEPALVSTPQGQVVRTDVRNNERVLLKNEETAEWLWERVRDFVPSEIDDRRAIGVNELLRFYRYDVGQEFKWHQDFAYERDNGETSFYTFMIYLNDDFEGGETSFEDSYSEDSFDDFKVVPKRGMALFFEHSNHHKGEPVVRGRKYVLRTDVMYSSEDLEDEWDDFDDENDDNW